MHARGTSLALISRAPLSRIQAYRERMGWTLPWYSSADSDFNDDFGLTTPKGETFGLSVFLRDGDAVFRLRAARSPDGKAVATLATRRSRTARRQGRASRA